MCYTHSKTEVWTVYQAKVNLRNCIRKWKLEMLKQFCRRQADVGWRVLPLHPAEISGKLDVRNVIYAIQFNM